MDAFEIIRKTMEEFADVPDDTVQAFISLAEPLISKKRFRKLYPQALAYLAAHKMKMSGLGKTIGIGTIGDTIGLSSVSEGETSVSFSNNQAGNIHHCRYQLPAVCLFVPPVCQGPLTSSETSCHQQ